MRVGDLRPSQLLYNYGVGAIVDLPNMATMVMGLDDWKVQYMNEVNEVRLLAAVRLRLGHQMERLAAPPMTEDAWDTYRGNFDERAAVGVPVAPFPRWLRCPFCDLLAPIKSGLFRLKSEPFKPELTRYVHENCPNSRRSPTVLPARFLTACEHGHLDDFPWVEYCHNFSPCAAPQLRLREWGASGSAADIMVSCDTCSANRRMSEAFGEEARELNMPMCRARRPHLRDTEDAPCEKRMKSILLGASNSWFPLTLSSLDIPRSSNRLAQLIDEHWQVLRQATSKDVLAGFKAIGVLKPFAEYSLDQLWDAIQARTVAGDNDESLSDLKTPEWDVFSNPTSKLNSSDFHLTPVDVPRHFSRQISRVVLVEKLREVRALIGFTRIESPGDYLDAGSIPPDHIMPLSRRPPTFVPAVEVRGEGVFIQFNEGLIHEWSARPSVQESVGEFQASHTRWRSKRNIPAPEAGFPGIRFAMIHSFAHALMRQLSIECGYSAASIRERIYSRDPASGKDAMAGVLIYTAAPDSEGTLGGLVSLGQPEELERLIGYALEQMRLCSSDPLCAEHHPPADGMSLHGAACHACLFSPETSCERGNNYLDRSLLVETFGRTGTAFFEIPEV